METFAVSMKDDSDYEEPRNGEAHHPGLPPPPALTNNIHMVRRMEVKARANNHHRNDHLRNGRKFDGGDHFIDLTEEAQFSRPHEAPITSISSPRAKRPSLVQLQKEPPRSELFQQNAALKEDNQWLMDEIRRLQGLKAAGAVEVIAVDLTASNNHAASPSSPPSSSPRPEASPRPQDSEGRLRGVMTKKGATVGELKSAILAVESLVDEARRELGNMMLRERRAAFEALHAAIDRGDEITLELAIEKARLAEVEGEDITKGEAKLAELRAMTPEQKAKKAARELEAKSKKEAFIFIKRDDADALQALVDKLGDEVRWKDWKDYAGRSLWRCALDLRASRVQHFLAPLVGQKLPEEAAKARRSVVSIPVIDQPSDEMGKRPSLESPTAGGRSSILSTGSGARGSLFRSRQVSGSSIISDGSDPRDSPVIAPKSPGSGEKMKPLELAGEQVLCAGSPLPPSAIPYMAGTPTGETAIGEDERTEGSNISPTRSEAEYSHYKTAAFRAVAQDDCESLADVLGNVHQDVWTKWENKAGKDLLTLSTERGSSGAYSMLARELGMLKETVRETFEERESVWVFEAGEVQPKRATVLEDTDAEVEDVLIEFWDGDDPPIRVERCLIHKMYH